MELQPLPTPQARAVAFLAIKMSIENILLQIGGEKACLYTCRYMEIEK